MEIVVAFEMKPGEDRRADARSIRRYPARVARQLALAHALDARVMSREFQNHAEMARALGFTRARITQLMNLLLLAPDIQEEILALEFPAGNQPISEHDLRAMVKAELWPDQRELWAHARAKASALVESKAS